MAATGSTSREAPMAPPPLCDDFADMLRGTKTALVASADGGSTVTQTGAASLPDPFPVPAPGDCPGPVTEALIETFVIEADGSCTATGTDADLIAGWLPIVGSMTDRLLDALSRHRIPVRWPAYLTASLTPIEQVNTDPHFDDDLYVEDDGVGVVAIAASHAGPTIAYHPLQARRATPRQPLEPVEGVFERFSAGAMARQHASADRIVVFPGFGQLHAGPVIDEPTTDPVRRLLVFRAGSDPVAVRRGSGPT